MVYSIHGRFNEDTSSKYGESNDECAQDKNYSNTRCTAVSKIRNADVRSKKSVYSAVRTGSLNNAVCSSYLEG